MRVFRGSAASFSKVLLLALLVDCNVCRYFRLGERSYTELDQFNKEQAEIQGMCFKPGTVFYTQ